MQSLLRTEAQELARKLSFDFGLTKEAQFHIAKELVNLAHRTEQAAYAKAAQIAASFSVDPMVGRAISTAILEEAKKQ